MFGVLVRITEISSAFLVIKAITILPENPP